MPDWLGDVGSAIAGAIFWPVGPLLFVAVVVDGIITWWRRERE